MLNQQGDQWKKYTTDLSFAMMSLARLFIEGDMPIPISIDVIVNLEMFSFNRKKKQIVRQTQKRRKLVFHQDSVITTETTMLYTKEVDLVIIAFVEMVVTQAIISSVNDMAREIKKCKSQVELLESQVGYYRANQHSIIEFIEYALEIQDELSLM